MESIVPGVPDRGGNDHYAIRGRLAWQPGDATDVDLIVRYLKADRETQAGLYSHEPACPNAQNQGEFTPPDLACEFWLTGPGEAGTGFEEPSIIPSRGGDPYKTAETEPSYVDREIVGTQVRVDHDFGGATLTSITDYQTSDKFYTEGGDASPVDGVFFFQGSDIDQVSQEFRLSWGAGDHQMVGGLFYMDVSGDYTGKFADPFYGYDPDVAFKQDTTSYAAFFQDDWKIHPQLTLNLGLRYDLTKNLVNLDCCVCWTISTMWGERSGKRCSDGCRSSGNGPRDDLVGRMKKQLYNGKTGKTCDRQKDQTIKPDDQHSSARCQLDIRFGQVD